MIQYVVILIFLLKNNILSMSIFQYFKSFFSSMYKKIYFIMFLYFFNFFLKKYFTWNEIQVKKLIWYYLVSFPTGSISCTVSRGTLCSCVPRCCLLLWLRVRFTCSHIFLCLVKETNLILLGRAHWFLLPSSRIGEAAKLLLLVVIFRNSGAWLHCRNVQFFFFFEKPMRKV